MHRTPSLKALPTLLSALLLTTITTTQAAYTLKDSYTSSTFFSMFDFFTDADPTNGYVDYQSQSAAQAASLISTSNNQIYMGVDSTSIGSGRGRKSVRITSKAVYNHGLILLDLQHMPGNICGVWPAFWTVGPNWPNNGEIDIIEGVNMQVGDSVALHTGPGCSVGGSGSGNTSPNTGSAQLIFSGTLKTSNCDVAATNQPTNAGCAITSSNSATYGDGLNSVNGGIYATEWTSSAISVWFFPRSNIPSDITSGNPNPSSWGSPIAAFGGGSCTIDNSFRNQQIVFDTTFCGDWAGSVWSSDPTCSAKASTCQAYVMNNPSAFKNAYWSINSLMVYTAGAGGSSPSSSAAISSSVSQPIGSGSTSATGIPVPVSSINSNSGFPSKSTSTSTTYSFSNSNPVPRPTSTIQPVPTATSTPTSTTITTSNYGNGTPNPGVPLPRPTTMTTSSRVGGAANSVPQSSTTWTWSWDGSSNNNGGGNNWGHPPLQRPGHRRDTACLSSLPERRNEQEGTGGLLTFDMKEKGEEAGELTRRLVTPVVRKDANEDGKAKVRREEHLRRHAGHVAVRRHGYAAAL